MRKPIRLLVSVLLAALVVLLVMYLWPKGDIRYPRDSDDFAEIFVVLMSLPVVFIHKYQKKTYSQPYLPSVISLAGVVAFFALVDGAPIDIASFMIILSLIAQAIVFWGLGIISGRVSERF